MSQSMGFIDRTVGTKSELALVLFMIGILLVLFTPIPAGLLDFLLIANFSFGLLVLILTFYMEKPVSFSTFPALLLIATLFRLSLNVAATRLILSEGDAGEVINAVGSYVVAGNYVIGLVVFLILIVVQYVVVTSGAQRVAEVAARFTLDSMPGKQMSIDADLNMGLIDEKQAQQRRKDVEKEANFYGSMDGASKFVKGDAIAGIIIILIDIIGGLIVGVAQLGMPWGEALEAYTLLTVGDGIVTQIPALIISTATGIIVTRSASDAQFGEEISAQISRYPKSLVIVTIGLVLFLLLPAMPALPVLTLMLIFGVLAYYAFKSNEYSEMLDEKSEESSDGDGVLIDDDDIYKTITVEPIEIFIGHELIDLLGDNDGVFMEKVKSFRRQYAMQMGFVFPSVRLKDDKQLDAHTYEFKVHGARVSHGRIFPEKDLVIGASEKLKNIEGDPVKDPTYGLDALWISAEEREKVKEMGCALVDPLTVLATHFNEMVRNYSQELLTREETETMLERVKESQQNLYEELVPNILSVGDIQKVLQNLLREKVSIRNINFVAEALVESGKATKDPDELTEFVRQKLNRVICESLVTDDKELKVLTFDTSIEQALQSGLRQSETRITMLVDPALTETILVELTKKVELMMADNLKPVLLCSPSLRRHVKKLTERLLPHLSILSLTEVPSIVEVKSYDIVKGDRQQLNRHLSQQMPVNKQPTDEK